MLAEVMALDPSGTSGSGNQPLTYSEETLADGYLHRGLDVSIISGMDVTIGTVNVDITGDHADLDEGAGTDEHEVFAIGIPGPAGHLVAGQDSQPIITEERVPDQSYSEEITCTVAATDYTWTAAPAKDVRSITIMPNSNPVECGGEITVKINGLVYADGMYFGDVLTIPYRYAGDIEIQSSNAGDKVRISALGDA